MTIVNVRLEIDMRTLGNKIIATIPKVMAMGALAATFSFLVGSAVAADRALLVGVGEYENQGVNSLPGIDLDVKMMRDNAQLMGFSERNVKVLRDQDATVAGVSSAIRNWLGRAGKNDRVLFYFSGHGTHVYDLSGDEPDGKDEVLCMYGTRPVQKQGRANLDGVLLDDEFALLLDGLESENVLIVLDNCHSGTATKSIGNLYTTTMNAGQYVTKLFNYPGMPSSSEGSFASTEKGIGSGRPVNYVALSACRDDEVSIATGQGSTFTLGISKALKSRAGKQEAISALELKNLAARFIEEELSVAEGGAKVFHPQINGNTTLYHSEIVLARVSNGNGPGWSEVEELVKASKTSGLNVTMDSSRYRIDDIAQISVDIKNPGHLYILNVGPDDEVTILFPNEHNRSSRVDAGRLTLPTANMGFEISVGGPPGKNLVAAIWSREDIVGLYESGAKATEDLVATLTPKGAVTIRSFITRAITDAGMVETIVR